MKISHLSASTFKGLIGLVAPYVKRAEGSDYSTIYLAVNRLNGQPDSYALDGRTFQPDHISDFSYPLPEGSVTFDHEDEVGQIFSLDFAHLKKTLASIGVHEIDIEVSPISPVTPDDVHMRLTVIDKKNDPDNAASSTVEHSVQKSSNQHVAVDYDLAVKTLSGHLIIPRIEHGTTLAPMVLGRALQATYKAVALAGRGYRSTTAAHLRVTPESLAAEALCSNLFVASDWGKESLLEVPADAQEMHLELSVNTARRLYEAAMREGTAVTLSYDTSAKTLIVAIGIYTFSVRAEVAADHPVYGFAGAAFAEGDEWSQFFVDRRLLTSAFQRARTLGLQTVGIEFSPGGSIEVLDIEGEYTTRIAATQHLFCEPRVSRTYEVSVPAMLAFLPLLTSDDVAIDFAREDAPIRITGVTPEDSITSVVRTL